jgi:hypothetical protein
MGDVHQCLYPHCPFKGGSSHFNQGCNNCLKGSDCWKLDSLHISYPNAEYDELDSMLHVSRNDKKPWRHETQINSLLIEPNEN